MRTAAGVPYVPRTSCVRVGVGVPGTVPPLNDCDAVSAYLPEQRAQLSAYP